MPHLTRMSVIPVFDVVAGPRPAMVAGRSADHEHLDRSLTVATAMTPAETGPFMGGLPGSKFDSGMGVANLPPRTRGKHY